MVFFFKDKQNLIYTVDTSNTINQKDIQKLEWLFNANFLTGKTEISGTFLGPRKSMVTPWSTNAVEITQNMVIKGIKRIEMFSEFDKNDNKHDPMINEVYSKLNQHVFNVSINPESIKEISDISTYNSKEGLALSVDEINYLENLSKKLKRKLTDSEVFGFSQVNSEHCRHKIFNGTFIIDNKKMKHSLLI